MNRLTIFAQAVIASFVLLSFAAHRCLALRHIFLANNIPICVIYLGLKRPAFRMTVGLAANAGEMPPVLPAPKRDWHKRFSVPRQMSERRVTIRPYESFRFGHYLSRFVLAWLVPSRCTVRNGISS